MVKEGLGWGELGGDRDGMVEGRLVVLEEGGVEVLVGKVEDVGGRVVVGDLVVGCEFVEDSLGEGDIDVRMEV